ncbi:hypothetical protein J6U76_07485 [bacterium]|nr:hypothetical protein [bacterium]
MKVDAKGRIAVPGFCRVNGATQFFVTFGRKRFLKLYDWEEFSKSMEVLDGLDPFDARTEEMKRVMLGGNKLEIDSHGRLTIPKNLRDWAGLSGEIVVTGVSSHMEIWNSDAFAAEFAANIADLGKNMQEIAENRKEPR